MSLSPFHLAIPVIDLEKTKQFYLDYLGCSLGRSSSSWVDLNFFGHQLVLHKVAETTETENHNQVDGQEIPVPHFGVVLDWEVWQQLSERLKTLKMRFVVEPYIRFAGKVGEQATFFFYDPSGNALEFKAFKNPDQLFAHSK